jgi:hypothetical protein
MEPTAMAPDYQSAGWSFVTQGSLFSQQLPYQAAYKLGLSESAPNVLAGLG